MRYRVHKQEVTRLRAIASELATLRPGRNAVAEQMPEMRQLLELDMLLVVSPVVDGTGLRAERFDNDGMPNAALVEELFTKVFAGSPPRYAWYNAAEPEGWQRNRVLDARSLMTDDALAATPFYQGCLRPAGLHRQRQPRVLVCEGRTLLGWFGGFHDGRVQPRHLGLLRRLIAPMRRRLSLDRQLGVTRRKEQALDHVLEELGAPAWIVSSDGRVQASNPGAQALRDVRGRELHDALVDRVAGRPTSVPIELTAVADAGTSHGWLAIARCGRDEQIAAAVACATRRWALTSRQQFVLRAIVAGCANMTIALELGVTERAVELQVTKLLERAGVGSRAALVAAVLGTFG